MTALSTALLRSRKLQEPRWLISHWKSQNLRTLEAVRVFEEPPSAPSSALGAEALRYARGGLKVPLVRKSYNTITVSIHVLRELYMWRRPWLCVARSHNEQNVIRLASRRWYTIDGRQRLSQHWIPATRGSNANPKQDEAHVLLAKAGFIHQAYSGVFQLLPLGLRVQNKIEKIIDHRMSSLGASKLSLSSLSTEGLWRRSGRLADASELLKVRTKAKDAFVLSPTHEEEITKLVASTISSPKDLPLRLYQISRKYRDERRPRQGLLRTREFVMKDLYTFDLTEQNALITYDEVQSAYSSLFRSLSIPYLVAEADTGNMGMSHCLCTLSPQYFVQSRSIT